jgi:hypothetical protein
MYVKITVEEIYFQQGRDFVPSVLKSEEQWFLSFQEPSSGSRFGFRPIAESTLV